MKTESARRRVLGAAVPVLLFTLLVAQAAAFNVRKSITYDETFYLAAALQTVADGRLGDVAELEWDPRPAVCVVMSSRGYPASSSKGDVIQGLDAAEEVPDVVVFHAGTARNDDDEVVTAGGRVLGVTALGDTIEQARERAYEAVSRIHFDGMQFRTDIASSALA